MTPRNSRKFTILIDNPYLNSHPFSLAIPHLLLLCVRGHGQWVVGQLIVPGLVGHDGEGLWPRPILPVYDGSEEPGGVGLVGDGQVTGLLAADIGREVKYL